MTHSARLPVRRFSIAALVALLACTAPLAGQVTLTTAPEALGMSSAGLAELTDALEAYVAADRLPGVVAMVLRDGQVAYAEAIGELDRESGTPMSMDAIFRIASQTKATVSVAVMILRDEGRLRLDDPIAKYLPAFRDSRVAARGERPVPAERPITVHDLLTHTAGIGYGYGPAADEWARAGIQGWYFAHLDEPVRATIDRMAALPMDRQPGSAFVYGYSTDILGALVEQVSGQSLDVFLDERIFRPLGMDDTHFYLPLSKRHRLATVYTQARDRTVVRAADGPGMETQGQYVQGPRRSFSGGAGLLSTADDYARFLQMMLEGGSLEGTRVLAAATVAEMTRNQSDSLFTRGSKGMGFGLGFSVRMDVAESGSPGSVGDYGWGGAYHSSYWVDPVEGLVVVYFTQVIPAAGLDDHARLRELVYAALTERRAEN